MTLDFRQFSRKNYVHVFEDVMGVCNKGYTLILGSVIVGLPGENGSRNRLYPNFVVEEKLFIGDGMKYFLIDKEDKKRLKEMRDNCQTIQEKYERTKEVVCNLIKFQEFYPQKRIYLRNVTNRNPDLVLFENVVFYEEAIEAAVIALKQQGAPLATIQKVESVLERNRVDKEDTKNVRTISIDKLDRIFRDYGVDRSLITIVPDPSSFALSRSCHQDGGVIRTVSPNLNVVLDLSNTLFFIFTCGVQGSDVSPVSKYNKDSGEKKMNRCKNLLQRYYKELKQNYVLASKVQKQIEKILLDYTPFPGQCHDFETRFLDQTAWTKISFKEFNMIAKALGINRYEVLSEFENAYPIWVARMLFSIAHLQQAYKEPTAMVRCLIRQFSYRTPSESMDSSREHVVLLKIYKCGKWMCRNIYHQFVPRPARPPQVNLRDNHPDLFRRIDELRRLEQPVDNVVLNMNDMNVMPLGTEFVNWNQGLAQIQNVQPNANLFAPLLAAPPQPVHWDDDQDMDWEDDAERLVLPPVNNFNNFNAIDMHPMGQFGQWGFGQNDIQRVQPLVDHMAPVLAAPAPQIAPQVAPQADPRDRQLRFMDWIVQAQEFMQQINMNLMAQWQRDQEEIARQAWEHQELQNQLQNQFGGHQFQ
ncbi:hypothetical protein L3Y34_013322 [Caenorhabditis briggsae]|uniref:Uncharacterized protein n=1 Tax=Caenorhabditis briggsae TaxID=6238 RepID=A0AAE9A1D1_CAEBR|nr:hypothetical protein L3Y34_013322 [Caenorhabditis briggsae]